MTHVVVDPVTRIEGHLRVEAEVDGGAVKEAWSSSTMFRGIELILRGRDPRDAWAFTQRICGVCTTVHAIASIRAVEKAIGAVPPPNARLLRNLIIGAQCVQDHVVHFYHLHALDWVDIVSALSADPAKTSSLAQSISDWPLSSTNYFSGVRDRIKAFVERGQLGPFANAYWGHPAYRLPPEANLMAVAHYLEALDWQRRFIKIHAILGGKNPHLQSFLVGGMATPVDPDSQNSLNIDTITALDKLVADGVAFVSRVYIPDVLAIASFYKDWASIGAGIGNYMSYGEYPEDDSENPQLFLPPGIIHGRDLSKIGTIDQAKISEYVAHSWYDYSVGDDKGLNPFKGETSPHYTGPKPPYERLEVAQKYSWLKSPRYDGDPMEVGPLARMLVAYASGRPARVKQLVDKVLSALGVGPAALFSTLGRIAARAIETQVLVESMDKWVRGLADGMARRDYRIQDNSKWDPGSWPRDCFGAGFHEAPRGSLGHWVHIANDAIVNYQCVVPSTWNAGPRDAQGHPGPYEAALVGTPVANPEQPLEILRTVHSFDPCMACGVHVVDATKRELARVRVR
jgi:hydrogenase large subunit